MEHIERAGGPFRRFDGGLSTTSTVRRNQANNRRLHDPLARGLNCIGMMNIQFRDPRQPSIYVIEVNPRASRTVPS